MKKRILIYISCMFLVVSSAIAAEPVEADQAPQYEEHECSDPRVALDHTAGPDKHIRINPYAWPQRAIRPYIAT